MVKKQQPAKERKRKASQSFSDLLMDGKETPYGLLTKVMRDKEAAKKVTPAQLQAARDLLPYALPRLQAIEAVPQGTIMGHEDALDALDDDTTEGDGDGKAEKTKAVKKSL